MTFKERLDAHIEVLEEVLKMMISNKCDDKSIAVVSGFLDTAKKFREVEDEQ
jgi:hypothetical protein